MILPSPVERLELHYLAVAPVEYLIDTLPQTAVDLGALRSSPRQSVDSA